MRILTISRQFGCPVDEITYKIMEKNSEFKVVNKEVLAHIASYMGKDEKDIDFFDQYKFSRLKMFKQKVSSYFDPNYLRNVIGADVKKLGVSDDVTTHYNLSAAAEESDFLTNYGRVFHSIAAEGKHIFIGRGAQYLFENHKEAVSIRLIATEEDRIEWMHQQAPSHNRYDIQKEMEQGDKRIVNYTKHYFGRDNSKPEDYSLVINLSKTGVDCAVEIINELL